PSPLLLDAARLPGGPWTATRTATTTWAGLEEALVPCGQRVIAPDKSQVRLRVFESPTGTSISELVIADTDPTQTFKRFYAECTTVGPVESKPGPNHVAHHNSKIEIATFTANHLIVISGPNTTKDLPKIADAARTQASQAE
ncbi:hypothetical protein, partial [Sphaerisporangium aureirubrum]